MATFYFNGAVDGDWQNLGNWWMDSGHTIPAISLPTSNDDVIAVSSIITNSGSAPTVANFTLNDPNVTIPYLGITITVTGLCTFNYSSYNIGTINGDCIFNDSSYNYGTINGDCILNDNTRSDGVSFGANGVINGDCIFNDYSQNYEADITGNCIFNNSSENNYGFINGDCIFNDSSRHTSGGSITGDCTFNDTSRNDNGTITGDCTFNDTSYNYHAYFQLSAINGDCIFNHSSVNGGRVNGNCIFSDSATNYRMWVNQWGDQTFRAGEVNGNCTFSLSSAAMTIDSALSWLLAKDSITGTIDFKYEKGINGSSILGIL